MLKQEKKVEKSNKKSKNNIKMNSQLFPKTKPVFPSIKRGILSARFCRRNTFLTIYDSTRSTIYNLSNGKLGFKGCKKSALYASEMNTKTTIKRLENLNFTALFLNLDGMSRARKKVLSLLNKIELRPRIIVEASSYAFNGCRLKKQRRRKQKRKMW